MTKKEILRRYRKKHKQELLQKNRAYFALYPERVRVSKRKYKKSVKGRISERRR
jgi:hypothetical protein